MMVKFNKLEFSSVIYQFIQNFILTMSAHKNISFFQKATVIWLHHWIFEYLWSVCYQGSVGQWCFIWKCLILLIFSYNPAEEEKGGFSNAGGGQFQADRFSKINPIKFLENVHYKKILVKAYTIDWSTDFNALIKTQVHIWHHPSAGYVYTVR